MRLRVALLGLAVLLAGSGAADARETGLIPTCPTGLVCNTLTLKALGNGSGTITSAPAGIDCVVVVGVQSGRCSAHFAAPPGSSAVWLDLTYTPAPGSQFWVDDLQCGRAGGGTPRSYTISRGFYTDYDAPFCFVLDRHPVVVSRSGPGLGKVSSVPAGIDCGSTCTINVDHGSQLVLTAEPDSGTRFARWLGACAGQAAVCRLTVQGATSAHAQFESVPSNQNPPAPASPPAPKDTDVDAQIVGARSSRSALGTRLVLIELDLGEPVAATVSLERAGRRLGAARTRSLQSGDRMLRLVVPKGVQRGTATVRIVLADAAANRLVQTRRVVIGRRDAAPSSRPRAS
ncbi:MAG: hypothetical protein U0R50_14490 [Gaiellales bacterium]